MTLAHLTMNTGHLRMSPRSEVSDAVIRSLDPVVMKASKATLDKPLRIPFMAGARLQIQRQEGGACILILASNGTTLVVSILCWESHKSDGLWGAIRTLQSAHHRQENLGPVPLVNQPETLPWLAVLLASPCVVLATGDIAALADFERCLAWTILAQEGIDEI